jgi:hypothetical protein
LHHNPLSFVGVADRNPRTKRSMEASVLHPNRNIPPAQALGHSATQSATLAL